MMYARKRRRQRRSTTFTVLRHRRLRGNGEAMGAPNDIVFLAFQHFDEIFSIGQETMSSPLWDRAYMAHPAEGKVTISVP